MPTITALIKKMPIVEWDYYQGLNNIEIPNPFTKKISHNKFIEKYFARGGKIDVLESAKIDISKLRLPNHINSVFFLGNIVYHKTKIHEKYSIQDNDPGYSAFPFIWFLIALFHDNAYAMEGKNILKGIEDIEGLKKHFNIEHSILDQPFSPDCIELHESIEKYFIYRKKHWKVVDHGILGGFLLFDRLVKIRREKKNLNEQNLFWGDNLEAQYLLAANAISLHNIWVAKEEEEEEEIYKKFELFNLINFKKIKFSDFPLFYLLAIIDTIEPLKVYTEDDFTDDYVFSNLYLNFTDNSIRVSCRSDSKLDFGKMLKQITYLENWLEIDIKKSKNHFKLIFNI